jgi:separase
LNRRAWAGLESIEADFSDAKNPNVVNHPEKLKDISSSKPKFYSTTHEALNRANLWQVVSPLFLGYIQLVTLYQHLGLSRESIYFAEQAMKIAGAVNAHAKVVQASVILGDLKVRCGDIENGKVHLESVREFVGDNRVSVSFEIAVGNLERLEGNLDGEVKAYQRAQQTIDEWLDLKVIESLGDLKNSQDELVDWYGSYPLSTCIAL